MTPPIPILNYSRYEETAFDVVPLLEGVVNGVVVFGVMSLHRAENGISGVKSVDPQEAYGGVGQAIRAVVQGSNGNSLESTIVVISFEEAYQRVGSDRLASYLRERRKVLLDRGPATAVFVKHPPIPVQKPIPVVVPVPEPKPSPIVPKSPITMMELLLQIAAMQTDFDLRMQVVAKRLAALETK